MPLRRLFLLMLLLAGLAFLAAGIQGYAAAYAGSAGDVASVQAASRKAMHELPLAAVGMVLVIAAAFGLWRDRG